MENKDRIEIPFGAKDSELCECEYTIPEGYEAEIKDGKVIIRKVESEDEKIRKELIEQVHHIIPNSNEMDKDGNMLPNYKKRIDRYVVWLKKQGKPTDIPADAVLDSNEDGLIADTIRCKKEKQSEQKPAE